MTANRFTEIRAVGVQDGLDLAQRESQPPQRKDPIQPLNVGLAVRVLSARHISLRRALLMAYVACMSRLDSDAVYGERLYDLFDDRRDYTTDAEHLRALAIAHRPTTMTWLDVACGTGHHLAALARWFEVAGVDISASMLASARGRASSCAWRVA